MEQAIVLVDVQLDHRVVSLELDRAQLTARRPGDLITAVITRVTSLNKKRNE